MANNLKDHLKEVADAIRAKKGTSDLINPQDFATEIEGISGGGESGGSQYHEIKPNGWYWKTTEAFRATNIEVFIAINGIYETIDDNNVNSFELACVNIGKLVAGNESTLPIRYIAEAAAKPNDGLGLPDSVTSVKDFFIAQGMPEDSFLSTMESMGLISITEEEYMAARTEKN